MPTRPRNPCPVTGCPELQPCPTHPRDPRPAWRTTTTTKQARGYGGQWEHLRAIQLRAHPWCNVCGQRATNVDHKRAKAFGGDDHPMNLRSLCDRCKKVKDAADAQEGKRRRRIP